MQEIREKAGYRECQCCGEMAVCDYVFGLPDGIYELYVCANCDEQREKAMEIQDDEYYNEILEYNKLHQALQNKTNEWKGLKAIEILNKYNRLKKKIQDNAVLMCPFDENGYVPI